MSAAYSQIVQTEDAVHVHTCIHTTYTKGEGRQRRGEEREQGKASVIKC